MLNTQCEKVENCCLFRSFVPPKIRGSQPISRPIESGLEMPLFYNFPFTSKHRNAVSRARHRGRVAYNANERKNGKSIQKK